MHYTGIESDEAFRSQNRHADAAPDGYDDARNEFAFLLNRVFKRAKTLKLPGMSARQIAEKYLGRSNEMISKWRLNPTDHDGARNRKPMPASALLRLPTWYVVEIFNEILRARGMKEYEP